MQNTINPQIEYIRSDSPYMPSSCGECPKKNTNACNTCGRKRTEPKPKSECHRCDENPKPKCDCKEKKEPCKDKRSVCTIGKHFAVQNYFSELVHDWEKEIARYNLGIQELESINYLTEETESGEYLNKVQFVFRKGHELITKEFLVAPRGKDGKSFTWDDLTDAQKDTLKGDKGDRGDDGKTPVLRFIKIEYSDSPCEVSGNFELISDNIYDLYLILPKQPTFEECLLQIQNTVNQIIDARVSAINDRLNAIESFDFSKLKLHINNNKIKLTYKGDEGNEVTINIPEQHDYTLKHYVNTDDYWKDSIALLKDGQVYGDTFSMEPYKPQDWWILPYPGVILLENGQLVTKKIRISAWFSQPNHPAVDKTDEYNITNKKNYEIYIQTTSSYLYNEETQQYDKSNWSSLNSMYNEKTGILTLPENFSIKHISEVVDGSIQEYNYQYVYNTGSFLIVVLLAPGTTTKRIIIPVIDISKNSTSEDSTIYLTDINPKDISTDISSAIINYTKSWQFDLRGLNIYDCGDNLINNIIIVQPSTFTYAYHDGKRYFCGNYEVVNNDDNTEITTTQLPVNNFRLVSITHDSVSSSKIKLKFKYNDNNQLKELTSAQYVKFYKFWKEHLNDYFNKVIRFKRRTTNEYVDLELLDYSSSGELGVIYYSYANTEIDNSEQGLLDNSTITAFNLHIKDSANYNVYLSATRIYAWIEFTQPETNVYNYGVYTDKFNEYVMSNINSSEVITINNQYIPSISPVTGTVCVNNMFFNNGLLIAENKLQGNTPTISDDGKYAYIIKDSSVQVQNLTNSTINVRINETDYQINPHAFIEEQSQTMETGEVTNP